MAVVKLLGYISIISLNGRDTKSILEWAERSIGSEEIKNESLSRFASNTRNKNRPFLIMVTSSLACFTEISLLFFSNPQQPKYR